MIDIIREKLNLKTEQINPVLHKGYERDTDDWLINKDDNKLGVDDYFKNKAEEFMKGTDYLYFLEEYHFNDSEIGLFLSDREGKTLVSFLKDRFPSCDVEFSDEDDIFFGVVYPVLPRDLVAELILTNNEYYNLDYRTFSEVVKGRN